METEITSNNRKIRIRGIRISEGFLQDLLGENSREMKIGSNNRELRINAGLNKWDATLLHFTSFNYIL